MVAFFYIPRYANTSIWQGVKMDSLYTYGYWFYKLINKFLLIKILLAMSYVFSQAGKIIMVSRD